MKFVKFKPVFTYWKGRVRLFRIIYKVGKGAGVGAPNNYHVSLKLSLDFKRPFYIQWERNDKVVVIFWIRFTYERSYGGIPC